MWIKVVEILLALCLAAPSADSAWTSGDSNYNKINSYLVDKTGARDTETNLIMASEMYNTELRRGLRANKPLLDALRQFLSLSELSNSERKCRKSGYLVLIANDKATGSLAKKATAPFRRVEIIVWNSAIKHAEECKDVYEITLKEKYESMDKIQVSRVHLYTDEIIMIDHMNSGFHLSAVNSLHLWERYIAEGRISVQGYAQTAYDSIYFISKADPDRIFLNYVTDEKKGNRILRTDKIEELFTNYLIKPCEYYVSQLDTDVFLPATYDGKLHKKAEDVNDNRRPLYWSWSRFRICKALIEQDRKAVVKEVIKVAAQEAKKNGLIK